MRDLRIPIGGFFSVAGIILAIAGITTSRRAPLESANVNLYCGAFLLAFGLVTLWLARRSW